MAGLTTAAYLARAGMDVHVFEQHTVPGGYVSSFQRKGFIFPGGTTSFCSSGIVFPILEDLGLKDRLRFVRADYQLSWGTHDIPLHSSTQVCEAFSRAFPHERRHLKHYFSWVRAGEAAFKAMHESNVMFGGGNGAFRTMFRLVFKNPLIPWAMAKARKKTNRDLHAGHFSDPKLRGFLDSLGYPVMEGLVTMGMWYSFFHDYHMPIGGMQVIPEAFVSYITGHGGTIHLGKRVSRILVKNRRVTGVRLEDGSEVSARFVVSAADMRTSLLGLLDEEHLPAPLIETLGKGSPSESMCVVYLGLDHDEGLASHLERFHANHVAFHPDGGEPFHIVWLDKDDPSVVPEGGHALWVGRGSPYERWSGLGREAYKEQKQKEAWNLIREAEKFIPGLSNHIRVMESATPLTFERYTGNWRGATAGWNWDPSRNPHIHPVRDLAIIKGLYFAGHWVYSPGGVPTAMITAWHVARQILKMHTGKRDEVTP
ncbi:phytoene desaturase family protein [Spirochaeta thermophila]|nr:NAD(P)/FAD-dependent oxidoreductase [Spirochaeta thermophila]